MTCIVAIEHNGKVYMGGDSAELSGFDIDFGKKIFFLGDFIIGSSGYLRLAQLIEFGLAIPEKADGESDMKYIVSKLIPAIRQCAKDNGYAKIESNIETFEGILLIGYHGKAYRVYGDFSVQRPSRGFTAIGCGQDFALGALEALRKHNHHGDIEEIITSALEVSGVFSAGVSAPYYVLSR